jgi:hypothetical protein
MVFDYGEESDRIRVEEWVEKSPAEMIGKSGEVEYEELTINEKEELENAPKGEFVDISKEYVKPFTLPEYVKIKGLYLAREVTVRDREFTPPEGEKTKTAIVFLPSGFADDSIIYLSDEKERVYSIKIHPITGKPRIYDEFIEAQKIQ